MVEYSYDSNGRMAQVKDDKAITKYVYTPGGEMERELLSNGQGTSYGYDGLGRLKELTHYGKNGEALDGREIGYDAAGRKTSVHIKKSQWVEEGGREHQERGVYSYAYDELGQLVKVTGPGHDTEHYSYDQLGNRIKKSITGSRRGQTHYVYDELNRLVEVRGPGEELGGYTIEEKAELTYDGRGNMIRIQSDGKNIGEYIYDSTNRLVRSATHEGVVASYAYDGAGRRVRKEISGRNYDYLIDVTTPYNEPLAVTSGGIREKYIYGNKRLGTKGKEGMAAYYFHDEMGSLIRTTDEKGASTGQAELDAFGRVVAFGNVKDGIQSLMSFTGYENDQGTGLMYVQARYYMPELGRFVAEDQNKGNAYIQPSLNYYIHCYNNPLKYVDRDGREPVILAEYKDEYETLQEDLTNLHRRIELEKGKLRKEYIHFQTIEVDILWETLTINYDLPGYLKALDEAYGSANQTPKYVNLEDVVKAAGGTVKENKNNKGKVTSVDVTHNGETYTLDEVSSQGKYKKSDSDEIYYTSFGKKKVDIHALNRIFGAQYVSDYEFICKDIQKLYDNAVKNMEPIDQYVDKMKDFYSMIEARDVMQKRVDEIEALSEESLEGIESKDTGNESNNIDLKGNYSDFLDALGFKESSDNYNTTSPSGTYLGRYQMGPDALKTIGFMDDNGNWTNLAKQYGVNSKQTFLNTPAAQEYAIRAYHQWMYKGIINNNIDDLFNTTFTGTVQGTGVTESADLTPSGVLASMHLVGRVATIKMLVGTDGTKGQIRKDGNGTTATSYMNSFGGYDLSDLLSWQP